MKLVRYLGDGGSARPGILIDDRVVPLADVAPGAPTDMLDVIGAWDGLRDAVANTAASSGTALNKVKLKAPKDSRDRPELRRSYRRIEGGWSQNTHRASLVLQAADVRERAFRRGSDAARV